MKDMSQSVKEKRQLVERIWWRVSESKISITDVCVNKMKHSVKRKTQIFHNVPTEITDYMKSSSNIPPLLFLEIV
jgi:hypothetical protein